jgi:hypothetical protein
MRDKEDMMSRLDQCERQLADVLDPRESGIPLQTLPQLCNALQVSEEVCYPKSQGNNVVNIDM